MRPGLAQLARQLTDARWPFQVAGLVVLASLLATCMPPPPVMEQVRALGYLTVATRNSPTAYYLGVDGPEGPEFDLVTRFAAELGLPVNWRIVRSSAEALEEVAHNRAHVAAAGIIASDARRLMVTFGPAYQEVTQHVVYRLGGRVPTGPHQLTDSRIEVVAGSTHAERLAELARTVPDLVYREAVGGDELELLARVSTGAIDFTLADSTEFSIGRHFHPDLRIGFDLPGTQPLAWALSPRDPSLLAPVQRFFERLVADDALQPILARYYQPAEGFDYVYSLNFVRHVQERLPGLRPHFEDAAHATGFDWRLLAAVGYQESKWDPDAVSRTGVRGVMMLTRDTAERVGVGDRRDARDSILGGADYLREIHGKIPPRIAEPDRTWLALAAYNVGFGHLEDARILTQRHGGNADAWVDVRRYLPLLAQERWYRELRRGYARGWEPVHFVRNVRRYLDVLVWMTGAPDSALRGAAEAAEALETEAPG